MLYFFIQIVNSTESIIKCSIVWFVVCGIILLITFLFALLNVPHNDRTSPSASLVEVVTVKNTNENNDQSVIDENESTNVAKQASGNQNKRQRKEGKIRCWTKSDLLGCGSFGKAFMALDLQRGEIFVVKQVPLIKDAKGKQLFTEQITAIRREIRHLSKLSHPNIVRYLGSSKTTNHLNIFLEYMSGGSIAQMLKKFGPFDVPLIRSYTSQILNGLVFLHAQKIVHRDIKGGNLLVHSDGCVKIADFGAARELAEVCSTCSLHGTAHWMAPEVIRQRPHDSRSDIWSLGITLIEMATTKPPWPDKDAISVMYLITSTRAMPEIPDSLGPLGKDFTQQCLKKDPNDRPSAAQLLRHPFLTTPIEIELEEETKSNDLEMNDVEQSEDFDEVDCKVAVDSSTASKPAPQPSRKKLGCIADVKEIVSSTIEYENETRRALWAKQYRNQRSNIHTRNDRDGQ